MIDHVSVPTSDLAAGTAFYDAVLSHLGMTRLVSREKTSGWGKRYPEFWINARSNLTAAPIDTATHIALRARSTDVVDAFYAAALATGGTCDGPPGPRQAAMTEYYGAFIRDLDGNKIEVLTFPSAD